MRDQVPSLSEKVLVLVLGLSHNRLDFHTQAWSLYGVTATVPTCKNVFRKLGQESIIEAAEMTSPLRFAWGNVQAVNVLDRRRRMSWRSLPPSPRVHLWGNGRAFSVNFEYGENHFDGVRRANSR